MRVETATVEAIDAATRTVTLKKPDGTVVTIVAGPDITRFGEIKVGNKVNARYYENVVVRVKRPGDPEVRGETKATTPAEQVLPGGTKAKQVTITATIAAVDMNIPSITFTGPHGWKVHIEGAGQGGPRQSESRRSSRDRLDRSGVGVGRARHVAALHHQIDHRDRHVVDSGSSDDKRGVIGVQVRPPIGRLSSPVDVVDNRLGKSARRVEPGICGAPRRLPCSNASNPYC